MKRLARELEERVPEWPESPPVGWAGGEDWGEKEEKEDELVAELVAPADGKMAPPEARAAWPRLMVIGGAWNHWMGYTWSCLLSCLVDRITESMGPMRR